MFKVGDKVVLVGTGTKDVLLEIVEHMYTPDMHRVKIIATGQYGPVFKNDIRHATFEEETAGHRIDNGKCPHGYDLACLLCGFGTADGHRVYHTWAKERPISRKRARKLRKRHGVCVYFSKQLECLVWVKTA